MGTSKMAERESTYGRLPILASEREFGVWHYTWICYAFSLATWTFIQGGYAAFLLPAIPGIGTIIIGMCVPYVAVYYCINHTCAKYGCAPNDFYKVTLGTRGSYIMVYISVISFFAWNILILAMLGQSSNVLLGAVQGAPIEGQARLVNVSAFTTLGLVIGTILAIRGMRFINKLYQIISPGLAVIGMLLAWFIFSNWSWADIIAAQPLAPWGPSDYGYPMINWTMALEWALGYGISWLCFNGVLSRTAKSQRTDAYAMNASMGLAASWFMIVGLISALMVGTFDPTEWVWTGGFAFGFIALLFIALANITTCALINYGGGIYLRENFKKTRWWLLMLGVFVVQAVFTIPLGFPDLVYNKEYLIVGYNTATFAPMVGMIMADYYLLRRQKVDMASMYELSPKGRYYYWGGVNIFAVINIVVCLAFYFSLYNPVTYTYGWAFPWIGAFVPTIALGAVLHIIFAKICQRLGKGGYDLKDEKNIPVVIEKPSI